jgi:hypothetical protein
LEFTNIDDDDAAADVVLCLFFIPTTFCSSAPRAVEYELVREESVPCDTERDRERVLDLSFFLSFRFFDRVRLVERRRLLGERARVADDRDRDLVLDRANDDAVAVEYLLDLELLLLLLLLLLL